MTGKDMNLLFDIIEILAGGYILYNAFRMKKSGELEGTGLVGKNINPFTARDVKGFINFMFPFYMICGWLFVICGAFIGFMDYQGTATQEMQRVITAIMLVNCIFFAVVTKRGQDKYLV